MTREDLKKLIKESIDEVFVEIGENYHEPSEPLEAGEDHFADNLEDYKDSLRRALDTLKKDEDNYKAYDRAIEIARMVHDIVENPRTSQSDKDLINTDSELEQMLGIVHKMWMDNGSSAPERTYVKETWEESISSGDLEEAIMTEKAPPGMEPWVQANKDRFVKQYGSKKGSGVLYATAWKMFYKKNKKNK
jgi:hypothetical protein